MKTLQKNLQEFNTQYKDKACSIIDEIVRLMDGTQPGPGQPAKHATDFIESLLDVKVNLQRTHYNLLVGGMVNNGKSTLCSAILGPSSDPALEGKYPLPIASTEATPILTEIVYSQRPFAKLIMKNGDETDLHFDDFIKRKVIQDVEEYEKEFGDIKLFRIGWPNELLRQGVVLKDSCGVGANDERSAESFLAIESADASVVVFTTMFPDPGVKFYKKVGASQQAFCIVNLSRDYSEHQDDLRKILQRIATDLIPEASLVSGNSSSAADLRKILEQHHIYCVNAKQALQAKYANNASLLEISNLPMVEQKLFEFFVNPQRKNNHFGRYINDACRLVNDVTSSHTKDIQKYKDELLIKQREIDCLESEKDEYEKSQTQATAIISKAEIDCKDELVKSYIDMIDQVTAEILSFVKLKKPTLISLAFGSLKKEIESITSKMLKEKLENWQDADAVLILNNARTNLLYQLKKLDKIPKQEIGADMKVAGGPHLISLTEEIGAWERIFSAAGGFFAGGIISGAAGAAFGARGATGGTVGAIIGGAVVFVVGITNLPLVIITILIGELIGMGASANGQLENFEMKTSGELSKKMETIKVNSATEIQNGLAANFQKLQAESDAAYNLEIKELEQIIVDNKTELQSILLIKTEAINQLASRISKLEKKKG